MKILLFITALLCAGINAHAATLELRLNGEAYYIPELDVTVAANANLAGTQMTYADALTWVASVEIGGVTGWVLPTTIQPDANCSNQSGSSSLGTGCSSLLPQLFDILGGTPNTSLASSHNANYDLITGIQEDKPFWSSTSFDNNPNTVYAWVHFFNGGRQDLYLKKNKGYAWAIFQGDAAPPVAVPVPSAIWLMLSGIIGIIGISRKK